jgi:DNA-directed RNA polymerase specialized sigma24 family protein
MEFYLQEVGRMSITVLPDSSEVTRQQFGVVCEQNYRPLHSFFLQQLRPDDAEDCTHESIRRFLARTEQLEREPPRHAEGYLWQVAYNLRNDRCSKKPSFFSIDDEESGLAELSDDRATINNIDDRLYYEKLYNRLQVLWNDLEEYEWELLCMHFAQDLTFEEIAVLKNEDVCVVRYETHKILMRLQKRQTNIAQQEKTDRLI